MIWIVVSGLNVATILAFSEEPEKVWRPLILLVAVPAALYLLGFGWERLRRPRKP